MAILRHGGMAKLFAACYAPSTLGSFLREFAFGHVRQLDAVASRFLLALIGLTGMFTRPAPTDTSVEDTSVEDTDTADSAPAGAGTGTALPGYIFLDVDDTIIEVHGHKKQGAGFGYTGVRGLNALLAVVSTATRAPIIVGQRLRRGAAGSPRGAKRMIADALAQLKRMPGLDGARVLFRADSAYYGQAAIQAAITAGAHVSVTVPMNSSVKKAIEAIPKQAWTPIKYTNAIFDEDTGRWISTAEVAEIDYTAFSSLKKAHRILGRLVVRRIPELNKKELPQPTLFDIHRFHGVFTTSTLDTVAADKTHRAHAQIEQVNADLKDSALAHMPSGLFNANAAWLVLACIAFNLTRAAATVTGTDLAKARTGTIRRKLVNLPARVATSARKIRLHLPQNWPWEHAWVALFGHALGPPGIVTI